MKSSHLSMHCDLESPAHKQGCEVSIRWMGFRSGGCMKQEWLRGDTPRPRSGAVVERRYPTSKVRSSSCEEIPQVQGKRALDSSPRSCHEAIPHLQGKGNWSKTVGTKRGHQRADRLKPQSQTTSQSDHTDHSLVSW